MNHEYVIANTKVEAFQITRETRQDNRDWPGWLDDAWNKPRWTRNSVFPQYLQGTDRLIVNVLGGYEYDLIPWGWWIIRNAAGTFELMGDEQFRRTFSKPEATVSG